MLKKFKDVKPGETFSDSYSGNTMMKIEYEVEIDDNTHEYEGAICLAPTESITGIPVSFGQGEVVMTHTLP